MSVFICVVGVLVLLAPCCLLVDIDTSHDMVVMEIVKKHNDLRRLVRPPARNMLQMNWNRDAAANAQKWANRCTKDHSPRKQRTVGLYSLKCLTATAMSWSETIQTWYNEGEEYSYKFNRPKHIGRYVGHYIRLVWANSNQIGCGAAHCPNSKFKYYYVCHYCPRGNLFGSKPYQANNFTMDFLYTVPSYICNGQHVQCDVLEFKHLFCYPLIVVSCIFLAHFQ
uniref:SCP domain-containing protein n=1 Tax=Esox lucius TaxID=8010 RepID=A0AAY5K238_ESOLU